MYFQIFQFTIAINIFRLQNRLLTICLPMRVNEYHQHTHKTFCFTEHDKTLLEQPEQNR